MAIDTIFKNIADAIREKAGTSGLITPAQMPQAIADIPAGGSSLITPIATDTHDVITSDGVTFRPNYDSWAYTDIYEVEPSKRYIVFLGATTRYPTRIAVFSSNPMNVPAGGSIKGRSIYNGPSNGPAPVAYYIAPMIAMSASEKYIVVLKNTYNQNDVHSYVTDTGL